MALFSSFAPALPEFSLWFEHLQSLVHQLSSQVEQAIVQGYTQLSQALAAGTSGVSAMVASQSLWLGVLYGLLLLVMLVGIIGAFVPALPGITLVLGAILVWALVKGFAGLYVALGVALVALVLSLAIDYLAGILGAQRVGASKWGQIGAFVGMALGLFGLLPTLPTGIPFLGLILGTVLGAFVGEFIHRRDLSPVKRTQQSAKVGLAIVVGTLVGNVLQGILSIATVVVFVVTTWPGG